VGGAGGGERDGKAGGGGGGGGGGERDGKAGDAGAAGGGGERDWHGSDRHPAAERTGLAPAEVLRAMAWERGHARPQVGVGQEGAPFRSARRLVTSYGCDDDEGHPARVSTGKGGVEMAY
jgi:hypothetical protein